MAKIEIEREHGLGSVDAAREKVDPLESKLNEKFGVTFDWTGNTAEIKGKGVSGQFVLDDERVTIRLKLGMLVTPFAAKIEESIRKTLERSLA